MGHRYEVTFYMVMNKEDMQEVDINPVDTLCVKTKTYCSGKRTGIPDYCCYMD